MAPSLKKTHKKHKAKRDPQHHDDKWKKPTTTSLPPLSLLVGAVLSLIVAAAVAWVQQYQQQYYYIGEFGDDTNVTAEPTSLSQLFQLACQHGKGRSPPLVQCNDYLLELLDTNRTIYSKQDHKSGSGLQQGWKLLDIPRNIQLWTIDAVRDPSVQAILLATQEQLSARAYLALYVAILSKRTRGIQQPDRSWSPKERFLKAYLTYLPTYDDFKDFHPVLATNSQNNDLSTNATFYSDFLIRQLQTQIETEYNAFCQATSSKTGQVIEIHNRQDTVRYISYQDYLTARLQVQTRSFTAGPLGPRDVSPDELAVFSKRIQAGNLLGNHEALRTALSSAMVPLLDAFNHHAEPNVGWKYIEGGNSNRHASSNSSSFAVFAAKDIAGGVQLMDTYGTTTPDSKWVWSTVWIETTFDFDNFSNMSVSFFHRIFAQYGFLNNDGG